MKTEWDDKYASDGYRFGTEPNEYLKQNLAKLKTGKILFPGEGEGRNAVFAASLGWQTDAFDQSIVGQRKAWKLAIQKNVSINYHLQSLENWDSQSAEYDCIALIFVHLPDGLRQQIHQAAIKALKPGGTLILEAFTINQLPRTSGGPKNAGLLYTSAQIASDFTSLKIEEFIETQAILDEGLAHSGLADLIRFTGQKL